MSLSKIVVWHWNDLNMRTRERYFINGSLTIVVVVVKHTLESLYYIGSKGCNGDGLNDLASDVRKSAGPKDISTNRLTCLNRLQAPREHACGMSTSFTASARRT